MMKAHRMLERLATSSIESSDVCLSDFAVMEMLLHKGPQPVNEIGRRIELTSGAITTAVDRLESRGFVTREPHESDRRARGAYSWNDFVSTLNAHGHDFQVQQVPADIYDTFFPGAPEVRETFQYFEQCTYFGPESGPRIAAAKAVYGAEFIGFSDWAQLNLAPTTGALMNA